MLYCFQSMSVPLVLMKAIFLFRKPLTKVALQRHQALDADLKSVAAVVTVCRRWFSTISESGACSRKQLKRLFFGESSMRRSHESSYMLLELLILAVK